MTRSTIWISYDLGIRGDYEGLYSWLDGHGAKECGESLAVLQYDHDGPIVEDLALDLKNHITIDKRSRIYVIYRDSIVERNKGRFIFGGRKAPVWGGYAAATATTEDTEV